MQPKTDYADFAAAVAEFEAALPGWWWTAGVCSVSRDASCGPDREGPDADLLEHRLFDNGFQCDAKGSVGDSLRAVMREALQARSEYRQVEDAERRARQLGLVERVLRENAPALRELAKR